MKDFVDFEIFGLPWNLIPQSKQVDDSDSIEEPCENTQKTRDMSSSPVPSSTDTAPSSSSASVASDCDIDHHSMTPVINTKCNLCHDTYTIPKVLSCFHTFCQPCIEKTLECPEKAICPMCQTETFLGAHGLSSLLPDFPVINFLEDNKSGETTLAFCTACKGKQATAVAKCYDCSNYLCPNCVMAHQLMHCFAGHRVMNLAEMQNNNKDESMKLEKLVNCIKHKSEVLRFFCKTCDVPICKECTLMEHSRGHEYDYLNDASIREMAELQQLSEQARVKASDLRGSSKNIEHSKNRLQSQYQSAQQEIYETYKFYVSMLEERKMESLKELDGVFNSKKVNLSTMTQKMQESIDKLNQGCEFIDKLIKYASSAEILLFKKMLDSKINNIMAYTPEVNLSNTMEVEFVSNYQAIQVGVKNTFGYVRQSQDPDQPKPTPISRPNGLTSFMNGTSLISGNSNSLLPATSNYINGDSLTNGLTNGLSSNGNLFDPTSNLLNSKNFPSNSSLSLNSLTDSLFSSSNPYERWSNGGGIDIFQNGDIFSTAADPVIDLTSKLITANIYPPKSQIKRQKMIYHCKFGEFGVSEGQFTEPSGVAVNAQNDIIVADTNNHRIQIFDKEGRFKFQFGECGKRDGQLLYPNRVAVVKNSGDIVVTERSPTHQVQVYNQYGQFVRKFGANILQHPRGVAIDNKGRIIIVECKVMRVIIFDQMGNVLNKFSCSKYLEFPNGVVVNDNEEIFISDNRAHCVKVFNYQGAFLRQIGGEGITNYPIGVGINNMGEVLIADNHNNFNLTVFTQDGQLINALESKVKHAQCFDVALMDEGSIVLASKDYRLYVYRYAQPPTIGFGC